VWVGSKDLGAGTSAGSCALWLGDRTVQIHLEIDFCVFTPMYLPGARGSVVVILSSIGPILPAALDSGVDSASIRNETQESSWGGD
jgi:hypothetical protein